MPTSGLACDKFAIRFLELYWYGQPSSNIGHRSQELLQGRLGLVTNAGAGDQRNEQSQTQTLVTGMRVRYSRVWVRDCGMNCGLICVLCIMACFVLKNFQLEKSRGQGDFKMARFHVTSFRYTYPHSFGIRDVKMSIETLNVHFCRRNGSPSRS